MCVFRLHTQIRFPENRFIISIKRGTQKRKTFTDAIRLLKKTNKKTTDVRLRKKRKAEEKEDEKTGKQAGREAHSVIQTDFR